MTPQDSLNCMKLRDAFEDREAIYIEHGFVRVRVRNIRYRLADRFIEADVEEIPTPGLDRGLLHRLLAGEPSPLRWEIGAGFLTTFSDHTWHMGYGGWSLFFAPAILQGLARLAATWPVEFDEMQRYEAALQFLEDQHAEEPTTRVFPD